MLTIITNSNTDFKRIYDVESHFKALMNIGEKFNDDIYTKIMQHIDNINQRDGGYIVTRFGGTDISNLSSGCKAVILAVRYRNSDKAVSVDECGDNALKVLFKISEKMDLTVYVSNYITVYDNTVSCIIDGKMYTGGHTIYRRLQEGK